MSPSEVWIPIVCYWVPMLLFFYMGAEVLLRNPRKIEHILVSLSILCYFLLLLEEYIRYMLPIEYSPVLAAVWFSNIGIAIPGLGFHLLAKLIGLDKHLPRPWYPLIFHILLLAIPAGLLSHQELISVQQFKEVGVWKWPVANGAYYGTLTVSLTLSMVSILMVRVARKWKSPADSKEHEGIFKLLEYGSLVTACWVAVFGYFQFGNVIPPYPYIYAGLIWCFVLRLAMQKYEFLNHSSHRYEKLFQLNPLPILLVAMDGTIKEVNPSARQMFDRVALDSAKLTALQGEVLMERLQDRAEIGELEAVLYNGDRVLETLVYGDYVTFHNEPHAILLIRDIGARNEYMRQVAFMAYHDALTELPNRRHFTERLEQAIAEAQQHGIKLLVMIIDLDDFKLINDWYGHEAGDLVLCGVGSVLRRAAEPVGVAARLGGDEFVLFRPVSSYEWTAEEALRWVEKAMKQEPIEYDGQHLDVQMSVGVSYYPQDGDTLDELLKQADKSMYDMKHRRKILQASEENDASP